MSTNRGELLRRPTPVTLLTAAGWTALATYFSTGGHDIGTLAWVAAVPMLAFAFGHAAAVRAGEPTVPGTARRIAVTSLVAAFAGNLSWLVLYRGIMPALPMLAMALALGLVFALCTWLTTFVASRVNAFAGTLAFPAAWVACEFAASRWSPHGTFANLAYTQAEVFPLIQVASLAGLAGISFVVVFVSAGIAGSLGDAGARRVNASLLAAPAILLVAAFVFGGWRVSNTPPVGRALVGLVSIDPHMRQSSTTDHVQATEVVTDYLEATAALASRGAEAVVWPEKMVGVTPADESEFDSLVGSLAEKDDIYIVAGWNLVGRAQPRNVASVYTKGRRVLLYDKRRLIPGFEAEYRRGDQPGLHKAPGGMLGVAICKDLDFPQLFFDYGQKGVGLLLAPAWDFGRDGAVHAKMARLRGVEEGFSVARAPAQGVLEGTDFFGRVLSDLPTEANPKALLLAELPLGPGRTFYSRYGDWFAWVNVVIAAALAAWAAFRRTAARPPR